MQYKNIWHVGGWTGNNVGDCVLQRSCQSLVMGSTNKNINFVSVDNQKTNFSENLIKKINKEADLLLLGGGGLIFHRPEDQSKSGWQFNICIEDLRKLNVPMAIWGAGFNKFRYDNRDFPQYTWAHIQECINKSYAFSVRNNGTYNVIKQNCTDISKIEVVPDPGMFVPADDFDNEIFKNNNLKICLNWATDRWEQRAEVGDIERQLDCVLDALHYIYQKYNAKIYIVEHLFGKPNYIYWVNRASMRTMAKNKFKNDCIFVADKIPEIYPPTDYNAGFFASIYGKMDVVLASRGHGCIVPFGQNTPVIGLGEHNKVKWFLEEVQMTDCLVELTDKNSFDILVKKIEDIIVNKSVYKERMKKKFDELKIINDNFVQKIVNIL